MQGNVNYLQYSRLIVYSCGDMFLPVDVFVDCLLDLDLTRGIVTGVYQYKNPKIKLID